MKKELPVVTNGCRGLCCVAFYISEDHQEKIDTGTVPGREIIKDMLIPLSVKEANARLDSFGSPAKRYRDDDEGKVFTCKHFDEENRLCMIYPNRPEMCSHYPYGRECEHGCSCKGEPITRGVNND